MNEMSMKANQPKIVNTVCAELSKSRLLRHSLHIAETLFHCAIEISRQRLALGNGDGL